MIKKSAIMIFFGPPGIGKGTLARKCLSSFDCKYLSTGNLCRQYSLLNNTMGKKVKELIDNGNLVSDKLIFEMINDYFIDFFNNSKDKIIILDGFPRNEKQFNVFFDLLKKNDKLNDSYFVFFKSNVDIILNRIEKRAICSNLKCENIYSLNKIENILCKLCNHSLIRRKDDEINSTQNRLYNYYSNESNIYKFIQDSGIKIIEIDGLLNEKDIFNYFNDYLKMENIVLNMDLKN